MELTGIDKKSPKANAYACVTQVVFPDNDGTLRCGRLAMCLPVTANRWFAVVGRWLFTNTWDPRTDRFDPEDDILGKDCYVGKWTTPFLRADKCHIRDKIIRPTIRIGSVVQVDHPHALVLLTEEFIESQEFREQGFWMTCKDQPQTKAGDKLFFAGGSTVNNQPVIVNLKSDKIVDVDESYWPEDNEPISCVRYLFR